VRICPPKESWRYFGKAWANEIEQTEFRDEEDPKELAATGEALVTKYMDQIAPKIDPAAVERKVEGEVAGIKVRGLDRSLRCRRKGNRHQDRESQAQLDRTHA
jgi:hypothetical protein